MPTLDHYHCPEGCEKPQPFENDGDLICGCCWFYYRERTKMIRCTLDTCPGEAHATEGATDA